MNSRKLYGQNRRNRFQFNDLKRFSGLMPVTGKCYMERKSNIWEMYVPYFQANGKKPEPTGACFRTKNAKNGYIR